MVTYWLRKIRYLNDSLRRPVLNIYLSNLNTHDSSQTKFAFIFMRL